MRDSRRWIGTASLSTLLAAIAMLPAIEALAYSTGPPDGMANNPPAFQNCTGCHGDFALNSGDGLLQLLDVPTTVTPGETYSLTVQLEDPGQVRWGFELTVLNDQNEASGTLVVTDPVGTQLSDNPEPSPDYLKHTSAGTAPGTPGPTQWMFDWVAGTDMQVDFYVAGNAANNSGDVFGDYIYAIQVTAGGPTSVYGIESPEHQRGVLLHQNRPNPFNPSTSISYRLDVAAHVTLHILDSQGRLVRTLLDRPQIAGSYSIAWGGVDDRGVAVPSGVYFYRLETLDGVHTRKMTLMK